MEEQDGTDEQTLYGLRLAELAQELARGLDPERKGLSVAEIQAALESHGERIFGDEPRNTVSWSLNASQHRFDRVGRGRWVWKATASTEGLRGTLLADEAYRVARDLDPEQAGVHYEEIKAAILAEGSPIGGTNPGNTLYGVLSNAKEWFEALGSGRFRWR